MAQVINSGFLTSMLASTVLIDFTNNGSMQLELSVTLEIYGNT